MHEPVGFSGYFHRREGILRAIFKLGALDPTINALERGDHMLFAYRVGCESVGCKFPTAGPPTNRNHRQHREDNLQKDIGRKSKGFIALRHLPGNEPANKVYERIHQACQHGGGKHISVVDMAHFMSKNCSNFTFIEIIDQAG